MNRREQTGARLRCRQGMKRLTVAEFHIVDPAEPRILERGTRIFQHRLHPSAIGQAPGWAFGGLSFGRASTTFPPKEFSWP